MKVNCEEPNWCNYWPQVMVSKTPHSVLIHFLKALATDASLPHRSLAGAPPSTLLIHNLLITLLLVYELPTFDFLHFQAAIRSWSHNGFQSGWNWSRGCCCLFVFWSTKTFERKEKGQGEKSCFQQCSEEILYCYWVFSFISYLEQREEKTSQW